MRKHYKSCQQELSSPNLESRKAKRQKQAPEVLCKKMCSLAKFTGKHLFQSLFFKKLFIRDTDTGAFLWILLNFSEHVFNRTPPYDYFYKRHLFTPDWCKSCCQVTTPRSCNFVSGQSANWKYVTLGIPQGSVLDLLLFLIYINNLPRGLHTDIKLIADDKSLFSVVDGIDESVWKLNNDLIRTQEWAY